MSLSAVRESGTGIPLVAELEQTGVRVTASCIPPTARNWSLDPLYGPDGAEKEALISALNTELSRLGVKRAYAPAAHLFSGRIADACRLSQVIGLGRLALYYNHGVPADGVPLEVGEAFLCGTGGCAALVSLGKGRCIAAHGGRDSLIDRKRYEDLGAGRPHTSVVDEMAEIVHNWQAPLARTTFHALFYLPHEAFGHPLNDPEDGKYHRAIVEYIRDIRGNCAYVMNGSAHLDIGKLAAVQARRAGFGSVCASHILPTDGPFAYTRHRDPDMRQKRNLVIVHRTA